MHTVAAGAYLVDYTTRYICLGHPGLVRQALTMYKVVALPMYKVVASRRGVRGRRIRQWVLS